MTFPWDPPPEQTHALTTAELPDMTHRLVAVPVEDVVKALQRDFAYAVTHTAVLVHSPHEALKILVNTPRGQIIPRGECRFTDGSTLELQDIGMAQVGAPLMTVKDLMARVWEVAKELGLELQS